MSDIKFILPSPETVTITGQTIEKLIRAGDGDAALLYLYILKTRGQSSTEEAAEALRRSADAIAGAMSELCRMGLVKRGENAPMPPPPEQEEPKQYTSGDIKRELENSSEFSSLVEETQKRLGKLLSPDDLVRLFGIYDGLRLPPEVIFMLITHCIEESRGKHGGGRMPTMRYIEKAAYTWEREGIFSLDRAEEYIKELYKRKSAEGEIKKALQIRDRELSSSERRYVGEWISMGFEADAIEIAYDRTLLKTGKLAWSYMDSIIRSWHGKGLHSPDEIQAKDGKSGFYKHKAQTGASPAAQKHGAPNPAEIERLKKLLEKIKEE